MSTNPLPVPVVPPARLALSAVVITKNEAENLPQCLASLAWADETVVVDSFSTDNTVAVAEQAGARVIQHPFANYAAQRNFAQAQARHDWVLFVDADERVSDGLRTEIEGLAASGELARYNAYYIQRVHLVSGAWFTTPPDRKATPALRAALRRQEVPRLINRRLANWQRALHEVVTVPEPVGVLDGVICHYGGTNLSLALEPFNAYTDLEAAYLHKQGKHASMLFALWRGARTFAFLFVLRGWFRYGENGLLMAAEQGIIKFAQYAKLWERRRIEAGQGIWTEADRALLERYRVDDRDSG